MFIYDYPPYLGPPLTNEEKEEYEKVWQKLREEGRGVEPLRRAHLRVQTVLPTIQRYLPRKENND